MPDSEEIPDEELSKRFWAGFLARNQSIIVDLMYGQLKSTVRCLECHNISISFDPFLTLSLPISRPLKFVVGLIPYEVYRNVMADGNEDEDPDYRDPRQYLLTEHPAFKFNIDSNTKVIDIKRKVIQQISKIGQREIYPHNLRLGVIKWGEMVEEFADDHPVEAIEQGNASQQTCFVETRTGEEPMRDSEKMIEFNFSKVAVSKKGQYNQQMINAGLPRFEACDLSETMLDIKKKIFNRI